MRLSLSDYGHFQGVRLLTLYMHLNISAMPRDTVTNNFPEVLTADF
jgi:hypothetical protein